jgi:hypothetical protein
VGAILCVPVFWPGVVRQANLDAGWVNAIAVAGVVLVCIATATARTPSDPRGDRLRVVIAAVALVVALPWLAAELGLFFPGPHVHLSLMFVYGLGNIANDFWGEQVVRRGWTSWDVPSVLEPRLTWAWLVLVVAALAVWLLSLPRSRAVARTRPPSRAR